MSDPLEQDERTTLEADLRLALQHRHAARERLRRTQEELHALLARARALLARARAQPDPPGSAPPALEHRD